MNGDRIAAGVFIAALAGSFVNPVCLFVLAPTGMVCGWRLGERVLKPRVV